MAHIVDGSRVWTTKLQCVYEWLLMVTGDTQIGLMWLLWQPDFLVSVCIFSHHWHLDHIYIYIYMTTI